MTSYAHDRKFYTHGMTFHVVLEGVEYDRHLKKKSVIALPRDFFKNQSDNALYRLIIL